MQHVANPLTLEVRYVARSWAAWLKSYGWRDATFAEWKAYHWSTLPKVEPRSKVKHTTEPFDMLELDGYAN